MSGISVDLPAGTFAGEMQRKVAAAATAAMLEAGNIVRTRARADIAAAGFSRRWQNALQVRTYPEKGEALDPAAFVFHKIPAAEIFESGGVIRGKPLLWLPLPSAPRGPGGRRMTPRQYVARGGKLASVNRPGRKPLLVAILARGRRVAMWIGEATVNIPKKFHIRDVMEAAANELPALFDKHLKD